MLNLHPSIYGKMDKGGKEQQNKQQYIIATHCNL